MDAAAVSIKKEWQITFRFKGCPAKAINIGRLIFKLLIERMGKVYCLAIGTKKIVINRKVFSSTLKIITGFKMRRPVILVL